MFTTLFFEELEEESRDVLSESLPLLSAAYRGIKQLHMHHTAGSPVAAPPRRNTLVADGAQKNQCQLK